QVTVGKDGQLAFSPNQIVARKGETVVFTFFPKAHSATTSSFNDPCNPLLGGTDNFDSGLMPVAANTTFGFPTYNITVQDDTKPIWIHCKQPGPPAHCGQGMVMAINAPTTGNTFDAFLAKAKLTATTTTTSSASTA
ncbi:hypothetical protein M422DRAFT_122077, partial [Sphaerobolus stellatus SS14]